MLTFLCSIVQWIAFILTTWKSNNIFTRILQCSIRTQKNFLHNLDKDALRDRLHGFVDKACDYCFDPEKLLEKIKSLTEFLFYFTMMATICFLWKFSDLNIVVVAIYLLYSYYDVIKRIYSILSSLWSLWNFVKTRWWVSCLVCFLTGTFCILAGTFVWSCIERLDFMICTIEHYSWIICVAGNFSCLNMESTPSLVRNLLSVFIKHCVSCFVKILIGVLNYAINYQYAVLFVMCVSALICIYKQSWYKLIFLKFKNLSKKKTDYSDVIVNPKNLSETSDNVDKVAEEASKIDLDEIIRRILMNPAYIPLSCELDTIEDSEKLNDIKTLLSIERKYLTFHSDSSGTLSGRESEKTEDCKKSSGKIPAKPHKIPSFKPEDAKKVVAVASETEVTSTKASGKSTPSKRDEMQPLNPEDIKKNVAAASQTEKASETELDEIFRRTSPSSEISTSFSELGKIEDCEKSSNTIKNPLSKKREDLTFFFSDSSSTTSGSEPEKNEDNEKSLGESGKENVKSDDRKD